MNGAVPRRNDVKSIANQLLVTESPKAWTRYVEGTQPLNCWSGFHPDAALISGKQEFVIPDNGDVFRW